MSNNCFRHVPLLAGLLLLGACGESDTASTEQETSESVAEETAALETAESAGEASADVAGCEAEEGVEYVCGLVNAEDIEQIGDTEWLIASGMNGDLVGNPEVDGRIHLINSSDRSWEVIFPADNPVLDHDTEMYPDCPGPLDVENFSVHGVSVQNWPEGSDQYRLYITSHGAREAIETFMIDTSAGKPAVKWTGCIPMPSSSWNNSVVILDDGGFMATQFFDPSGPGMEAIRTGENTGHVWEWHPGTEVTKIEGTELSGPNGIEISDDGQTLFVAGFGNYFVARYDLSVSPPARTVADMNIDPDNLRWTPQGTLLTAGARVEDACNEPGCVASWSVWEVDPDTMQAEEIFTMPAGSAIGVTSVAKQVGDEIWVGTYLGDRIGVIDRNDL